MSDVPEHILRQEGKVIRPQWCNCLNGFWMRNLVDPQCHYHSDYAYELRKLLGRAADALEAHLPMKQYAFGSQLPHYDLITQLRKAAQ